MGIARGIFMSGWRQAMTVPQRFPREPTRVAVRISTVDPELDPDTGESFYRSTEATTANLSRGGAFIHSWEPLAAGRRVIVVLDLPWGGELQLVGQVVWTRRRLQSPGQGALEAPGYGIEFVGGTRGDQAAIQQILDARQTSSSPSPTSAESTAPAPSAISSASETISTSVPATAKNTPARPSRRFIPGP
jgi:Tfp pilus assembly protein PilZ